DTVSLYITTYQAMLPQVLKAKYDKEVVKISDAPLDPELAPLFDEGSPVSYERVIESISTVTLLKDAIEAGQLKINYLVKSRASKQYETIIHPANKERLKKALTEVRAQASRQRQILNYFIERNEPVNQSVLYNNLSITRSHLNPLLEKGWLTISKREVYRNPYEKDIVQTEKLSLTHEQKIALEAINKSIDVEEHVTFLLHGVTGSGKTTSCDRTSCSIIISSIFFDSTSR